ncbi:hypothetical protein PMIN01_00731 [Paraphaeosphaeria minitans]|uniref:Uncharacterized protein n=1 Tax=Paraphaeosphaeria minitans TaxID=565426 RepID=A0A9P6GST1_9PLEO|nr:hypothetical protein PMIN01_00731 [Paraphaeosphaeria minitans]
MLGAPCSSKRGRRRGGFKVVQRQLEGAVQVRRHGECVQRRGQGVYKRDPLIAGIEGRWVRFGGGGGAWCWHATLTHCELANACCSGFRGYLRPDPKAGWAKRLLAVVMRVSSTRGCGEVVSGVEGLWLCSPPCKGMQALVVAIPDSLARPFLTTRCWDVGRGTWEVGSGKWEVGREKWDVGRGTWDVGHGT